MGIAVIGFSAVVNVGVSTYLYRQAEKTDSPALEGDAAHLRTDAMTSFGVLLGLVLVEVTGVEIFDPITALLVAAAIVVAGLRILRRSSRVLVDEALPADELEVVRQSIEEHGAEEIVGFHKLRARRAGSRRYVDLHVQFRDGTTLARAHEVSHELEAAIRAGCGGPTCWCTSSPSSARSEKVHGGRDAHGDQHARIPRVAVEQQQDGGDQADAEGHPPGDPGQGHNAVYCDLGWRRRPFRRPKRRPLWSSSRVR